MKKLSAHVYQTYQSKNTTKNCFLLFEKIDVKYDVEETHATPNSS